MQVIRLFDLFIRILEQDSRDQAVRLYFEEVMDYANELGVLVCYEPDVTNKNLEPSVLIENNDVQKIVMKSAEINDLENPVSVSYVMKKMQQFDLHSGFVNSPDFLDLRKFLTGKWCVKLVPLSIRGRITPIAILMIIGRNKTQYEDPLWDKKIQLLAILFHLQNERDKLGSRENTFNNQIKQTVDMEKRETQIEQVGKYFIGSDSASRKVQRGIVTASYSRLSVLIRGETGCGKDLVASQIHQISETPDAPFVAVNCAALPTELIEAELFGCKKGSYTGSVEDRKGLVESAQGGTLFLDEIGDMPYPLQAVLLRVLNEKTYRRVGENIERKANFRLICASNAPLEKMIEQGTFRKDLYYRICQLQLSVPPLRRHSEDVFLLATHFTKLYSSETGQYHSPLSSSLTNKLREYEWPGNVRELKNFVFTYLTQYIPSNSDEYEFFNRFMDEWKCQNGTSAYDELSDGLFGSADLRQASRLFEKKVIVDRLRQFDGNREKAAESLGIPKRTLAYKCKKLGISLGSVESL